MSSRFNFTAMQYMSNNNFEHFEGYNSNAKEVYLPNTTVSEDQFMLESRFGLKDNQNFTGGCQISFQNDFMAQHQAVFKRQLQNYMESVRIHLQTNGHSIHSKFPEGLHSLNTNMTWSELIMMTGMELSEQMKDKFIDDLKTYDKLSEFLNIVANQCPADITIELMLVSQQILEEFLRSEHKDNDHVDCAILLEIASNKCKSLNNINLLNLSVISSSSSKDNELMTKYQRFIEVYCATTILLIAQYFPNPYHEKVEDKGLKRSLNSFSSDEEEEEGSEPKIETQPKKKRKLSF